MSKGLGNHRNELLSSMQCSTGLGTTSAQCHLHDFYHLHARELQENKVLNVCAEYVGRMLCGTKLMFGHVAQVLILIKRAKDVSIKHYISLSLRKQYAHTSTTLFTPKNATPCKNFFETCGACTKVCVRTRKRDYATIK